MLYVVISPHVFHTWELIYTPTCYLYTTHITNNFLLVFNIIINSSHLAPSQGHFLTFRTFTSPHKVGHLRILEQGQIPIPSLAWDGGGGDGVYIESCIITLCMISSARDCTKNLKVATVIQFSKSPQFTVVE